MEDFEPVVMDPPAKTVRSTPMQEKLAFARAHEGQWVLIRQHPKKSTLNSYGGNIHGGSHRGVRKGEFDYAVGEVEGQTTEDGQPLYGVWIRWNGEQPAEQPNTEAAPEPQPAF